MAVKGMHLAWIVVSDLKKAKKFFTESIGLKLGECHEENNWLELSGEDGYKLGVGTASPHNPIGKGQNAIVTITVEDMTKSRSQLSKKGVKLIGDVMEIPGHVKLQLFEDPDGNKFQLVEELSNYSS